MFSHALSIKDWQRGTNNDDMHCAELNKISFNYGIYSSCLYINFLKIKHFVQLELFYSIVISLFHSFEIIK